MPINDSNSLLLPSLFIKGFRGFRELIIPELQRVTLFVGKNGIGKTSVIEATQLYVERGYFSVISSILRARDEFALTNDDNANTAYISDFTPLFYRNESNETLEVVIGPNDNSPKLTISRTSLSPNEVVTWEGFFPSNVSINYNQAIKISIGTSAYNIPWEFVANSGVGRFGRIQDFLNMNYKINVNDVFSTVQYQTLGSHFFNMYNLSNIWDSIALTKYEELIADAFTRVFETKTERFAVVGNGDPRKFYQRRFLVKLRNQPLPIPLKSLGDGATKLFGVLLSMIGSKNGFLFIDEVETGIHFSIQENYWRLIFEMAKEFNVQVIATTHSFDCIKAISKIIGNSEFSSATVYRLFDDGENIRSYEFDQQDIETAARHNIEVR